MWRLVCDQFINKLTANEPEQIQRSSLKLMLMRYTLGKRTFTHTPRWISTDH